MAKYMTWDDCIKAAEKVMAKGYVKLFLGGLLAGFGITTICDGAYSVGAGNAAKTMTEEIEKAVEITKD